MKNKEIGRITYLIIIGGIAIYGIGLLFLIFSNQPPLWPLWGPAAIMVGALTKILKLAILEMKLVRSQNDFTFLNARQGEDAEKAIELFKKWLESSKTSSLLLVFSAIIATTSLVWPEPGKIRIAIVCATICLLIKWLRMAFLEKDLLSRAHLLTRRVKEGLQKTKKS